MGGQGGQGGQGYFRVNAHRIKKRNFVGAQDHVIKTFE